MLVVLLEDGLVDDVLHGVSEDLGSDLLHAGLVVGGSHVDGRLVGDEV